MAIAPLGRKIPYCNMNDIYSSEVESVWLDGIQSHDNWVVLDARNGEGIRFKKGPNGECILHEGNIDQMERVTGRFEIYTKDWEDPEYHKIPFTMDGDE